MGRTLK